jgi:hypothetical protein
LNINAYAKDVKIGYAPSSGDVAAYAERHHGGDLAEDHIQLPLGDDLLEITYIQPYREALEPSAGSAAGARNGVTIGAAGPPTAIATVVRLPAGTGRGVTRGGRCGRLAIVG